MNQPHPSRIVLISDKQDRKVKKRLKLKDVEKTFHIRMVAFSDNKGSSYGPIVYIGGLLVGSCSYSIFKIFLT